MTLKIYLLILILTICYVFGILISGNGIFELIEKKQLINFFIFTPS
jgi:hypothetical protein